MKENNDNGVPSNEDQKISNQMPQNDQMGSITYDLNMQVRV
jgi:hypothetical protein